MPSWNLIFNEFFLWEITILDLIDYNNPNNSIGGYQYNFHLTGEEVEF